MSTVLKGWFLDLALYRQVTLEIRQIAVDNLEIGVASR